MVLQHIPPRFQFSNDHIVLGSNLTVLAAFCPWKRYFQAVSPAWLHFLRQKRALPAALVTLERVILVIDHIEDVSCLDVASCLIFLRFLENLTTFFSRSYSGEPVLISYVLGVHFGDENGGSRKRKCQHDNLVLCYMTLESRPLRLTPLVERIPLSH